MERCWSRRHRTSVAQARATTTASSWTEDGKRLEAGVLATWDICSGNWSAVHDEGGLLAKTWEMRVQSTQSILRPFSQRRGPICVVCLSLNQAIPLFLLLRASRAGFAVDEAINDLPGTQYARGSDQKQGRTAGGKRALTRASDRPAPTGQTPCVPEDGPVPPGARCARMVRTWKQALFLVQPETLLRGPRELFRWFWKRKSKVPARKQRLSPETISLIKEMVANNRRLRSRADPWRVAQTGYQGE